MSEPTPDPEQEHPGPVTPEEAQTRYQPPTELDPVQVRHGDLANQLTDWLGSQDNVSDVLFSQNSPTITIVTFRLMDVPYALAFNRAG